MTHPYITAVRNAVGARMERMPFSPWSWVRVALEFCALLFAWIGFGFFLTAPDRPRVWVVLAVAAGLMCLADRTFQRAAELLGAGE